jgi:hypothetical protein
MEKENSNTEATLAVVVDRLSSLHNDVNDLRDSMKESMKEMAAAVTRLVETEQRQLYTVQTVERQGEALQRISDRVSELEKAQPVTNLFVSWIQRAVWAILGVVLAFIAKSAGLI